MAVTSGFFNSINHDRLYDAEQLSSIFDGIVLDGVYESIGTAFMVSAINGEMAVKIGTGRAWFDHIWVLNDSEFVVNLDPANVALPRIDAIVLDIDKRTNNRTGSIKYIRGDYSSSPVRPSLVKEDNVHVQYPIAYIEVASGSNVTIDQTKITRTVGTSECPYVLGVLTAINVDTYWKQLETEFNIWWDGVKDTISSENLLDIELRLQNVEKKTNELDKNVVLAPDYVYEQETLVTYDMYNTWINGTEIIRDFILPDKKFVALFSKTAAFCCSKVYGLEDVKKANTNEYAGELVSVDVGATKIADSKDVNWFYRNVSVIKAELETYPVNIYVYYFKPVYSSNNFTSSILKNAYADIIKITISVDHVISYSTVSSTKTLLNNKSGVPSSYNNYLRMAHTTCFPLRVFGDDYTFISTTLAMVTDSSFIYTRMKLQNVSYDKETLVVKINTESTLSGDHSTSDFGAIVGTNIKLIGYGRSDSSGYVLTFVTSSNAGYSGIVNNAVIVGDISFKNVELIDYSKSDLKAEEFNNRYFNNIRFCSDIEVTVYKGRYKYVYTDKPVPSKSLCESTLSGGTSKFISDRQLGWSFTIYPRMRLTDDVSIGFESMNDYPFYSNWSDENDRRITLYNVYNASVDRISEYKNSIMMQCGVDIDRTDLLLGSEFPIVYALSHNHFPLRVFSDAILISSYGEIVFRCLENFKCNDDDPRLFDNVQIYSSSCTEPIMLVKKRS